jgi:hypothetical protein
MGSRVCSYSAAFHSVVVFRRIPGKRTARPDLNGEQLRMGILQMKREDYMKIAMTMGITFKQSAD